MYDTGEYGIFTHTVSEVVRSLVSESYRTNRKSTENRREADGKCSKKMSIQSVQRDQHYFEVIFVDDLDSEDESILLEKFEAIRSDKESLTYKVIMLSSLEDALIALLFNPNIQACVIRSGIKYSSQMDLTCIHPFIAGLNRIKSQVKKREMDLGA